MLLPITYMQPAYDLKPVVSYRSGIAVIDAGAQKENANGKEAIVIKTADTTSVEWPVLIGAADIYSVTIKYYYPQEKELVAGIQLTGPGGTLMLEEPVRFSFTRSGKWNSLTFNTHTMVNAGNYKIKLLLKNAAGLALSGIDIQ